MSLHTFGCRSCKMVRMLSHVYVSCCIIDLHHDSPTLQPSLCVTSAAAGCTATVVSLSAHQCIQNNSDSDRSPRNPWYINVRPFIMACLHGRHFVFVLARIQSIYIYTHVLHIDRCAWLHSRALRPAAPVTPVGDKLAKSAPPIISDSLTALQALIYLAI